MVTLGILNNNEELPKMTIANFQHLPTTIAAQALPVFPPLEQVTRPTVPTDQAAYYLNRQPQSMRAWSCLQPAGAIRPIKVCGRLAWPVAAIRALLEGGAA